MSDAHQVSWYVQTVKQGRTAGEDDQVERFSSGSFRAFREQIQYSLNHCAKCIILSSGNDRRCTQNSKVVHR